jgi:D-lyxose ketol-isomerase
MKRSEVNAIISDMKQLLAGHHFYLPEWATWSPGQWKGQYNNCSEIIDNKLGWDITDFSSGNFDKCGLALFTIRNGNWNKKDKMYCEKIMMAGEGQQTPMHFHWNKTEDIINRGGGNLVMELFKSAMDENLSDDPVMVSIDGILHEVQPGKPVILRPGQSICLMPRVYHQFYGEAGKGSVIIGEVSLVNDDEHDNRFLKPVGRFPEIDEDEEPVHLLVNDYRNYI